MSATVTRAAYSPEDLLVMPDAVAYELVDGNLVDRNMGATSSWVGGEVYARLRDFCRANNKGWVWPADNSYQCFPDAPNKVRKPDVALILRGRLPGEQLPEGHIRIPPDLVAEVLSPNDLASEIEVKVNEYLAAGVRLVWVINPELHSIMIYRADGSAARLREDQELTGGDVLPGFTCPVRDLFPPAVASASPA